jgi:hypothetical protein
MIRWWLPCVFKAMVKYVQFFSAVVGVHLKVVNGLIESPTPMDFMYNNLQKVLSVYNGGEFLEY